MKRSKLLIVCKNQFGYLIDAYKWCEHLKDEYEITYLCFNTGQQIINMPGINIKYVNYSGPNYIRGLRFMLYAIKNIAFFKGKIIIVYFDYCKFLKLLFPAKKLILDIRTLSISPIKAQRYKYDRTLISTCKYYDIISVVSEGIKKKIKITNKEKIHVLPLGADIISQEQKDYTTLKLLYVGTLSGRNIDKTIEGISIFHKKYPQIKLSYDIIGSGINNEVETYKVLTKRLNIDNLVTLYGQIPHTQLKSFFDKSNIGVSFIPMTEYYDMQPPTKTFEYILSGLYCIATSTSENKKVISPLNGILIKDSAIDFANGIEQIYNNRKVIQESNIRNSLQESLWSNIVNNKLRKILSLG